MEVFSFTEVSICISFISLLEMFGVFKPVLSVVLKGKLCTYLNCAYK